MNLKIEEQNLTFKISKEELASLLEGHSLNTKINFIDKSFIVAIYPKGTYLETDLLCKNDDIYLTISVPNKKLKELESLGKNREGVSCNSNGVMISLQVDIRKDPSKVVET